MGKVADIARIREILAENLLLRHKLRLLGPRNGPGPDGAGRPGDPVAECVI